MYLLTYFSGLFTGPQVSRNRTKMEERAERRLFIGVSTGTKSVTIAQCQSYRREYSGTSLMAHGVQQNQRTCTSE